MTSTSSGSTRLTLVAMFSTLTTQQGIIFRHGMPSKRRSISRTLEDCDLATYQSLASTATGISTHVGLSDLLAINDVLSPDEQVRFRS
ncbi:hypothetical protein F4604DRAFT_1749162 [Suillus subluteus]|nr:hypothetical protein F4604DRAFT_1749162 [Suillus subluteus]